MNRVRAPKDTVVDGERILIQKHKRFCWMLELVELGEFQRFTLKWTIGTAMVMLLVAIITGVITL